MESISRLPDIAAVVDAARRIAPYIHRTPVLTCRSLDELVGASLFFKCENFQKTGSFKVRGGCNVILSLSTRQAERGVVTHSSGNHGAAIAYAASLRGMSARIVMGENATTTKVRNVSRFGAEVIRCAPSLRARQRTCDDLVERYGCLPIPLSDNEAIIAGQGTAALELLEDVQDLDALIAPVGGGGLLCGTAIVSATRSPLTEVHGAEPIAADDAARSLISGRVEPLEAPQTIADGLHATLSERTLAGIRQHVKSIGTATEDGIRLAMKLTAEHLKIVAEPSASVPLACLLEHSLALRGRRVGIILSGGNIEWRA